MGYPLYADFSVSLHFNNCMVTYDLLHIYKTTYDFLLQTYSFHAHLPAKDVSLIMTMVVNRSFSLLSRHLFVDIREVRRGVYGAYTPDFMPHL